MLISFLLFPNLLFSYLFSSLLYSSVLLSLVFSSLISYRLFFVFSLLSTFNRFWYEQCSTIRCYDFFLICLHFIACRPNWNQLRLYCIIRHLIIWHLIDFLLKDSILKLCLQTTVSMWIKGCWDRNLWEFCQLLLRN